ncbi:hypothetical protein V9T40_000947 [Parthenolecanium corni]|uniref:Uncharacterized protein n=1 Tax=Parthenolecanium corni TaxID=536013 RepID=A0AAN9Y280_9HEMI
MLLRATPNEGSDVTMKSVYCAIFASYFFGHYTAPLHVMRTNASSVYATNNQQFPPAASNSNLVEGVQPVFKSLILLLETYISLGKVLRHIGAVIVHIVHRG